MLRVCAGKGCPNLTKASYCETCAPMADQHRRRFQTGATAYNSAKWIRARDRYRAEHPFCVNAKAGLSTCTLTTDVVDHIIPHEGDVSTFWDEGNWQSMCHSCHSTKTAGEVAARGRGRGGRSSDQNRHPREAPAGNFRNLHHPVQTGGA